MDKWKRVCRIIPSGVQTMSKMPSRYAKGYPEFIKYASGCHIFDEKEKQYIDYPCSLGAIILGHYFKPVDDAVREQLQKGILYSLSSPLEYELAKKLTEIIPCAEMVRFLKTGSEACSAAIKIARSYTKRKHIASYGYHGWHEWYYRHEFEYNNLKSLERILKKYKVAAVITVPYVYEAPIYGFLHELIKLSHKYGAVVIFDEIITGFRTKDMTAQAYFGVMPDLATFSKGMANGYPISCVVGKKRYMKELEKYCFVSSTFGGDLIGIIAALKTIEFIEKNNVISHIWLMGLLLKNAFNMFAENNKVDARCIGYPCRTSFKFPSWKEKQRFWTQCLKRGVFFGIAQFISYSHKEEDMIKTGNVIRRVFRWLQQ